MLKKILAQIRKQFESFCVEIFDTKSRRGKVFRRGTLIFAAISVSISFVICLLSDIDNKAVKVLYVDGEKVGIIDSPMVYMNAKEDAEAELSSEYGIAYRFPEDSAYYVLSTRTGGSCLTKQEIRSHLIGNAQKHFSKGFGLYIDNTLIAVGADKDSVQRVLDDTLALYKQLYSKIKTSDDIIVFTSSTKIEEMQVPTGIIQTYEEMRKTIGLDDMADLNEVLLRDFELTDEMTIKDLSLMLPQIDSITEEDISLGLPSENIYYVGETSGSNIHQAPEKNETSISFSSSSVEVLTEVLPCGEKVIYDKTLKQGKKILVSSGVYGIKESTYDVTYLNGEELTRTLISEEIVKEPISKVYKIGTKAAKLNDYIYAEPGESSPGPQGYLIMPTTGTLTSEFSGRNLFGKIEFHGAVDIANKQGTPVYAADGGTVILAEWFSTYGNCVIIDHGNGLKTLYAHLSSYSVKKGDVVGQGWRIGAIGRTGRTTGAHLHFEVLINDVKVDPLQYLK